MHNAQYPQTDTHIDNSFFHQNYKNVKVLLFVPHQDDEINAAASLLFTLAHCGAQITLVYTTNGDWECPQPYVLTKQSMQPVCWAYPEKIYCLWDMGTP